MVGDPHNTMASLRRLMSEFGFESNDDYDYQLRRLLDKPAGRLRRYGGVASC